MGYDMYLVDRDTSMDAEREATGKAVEEAIAERNKHERNAPEFEAAQTKVLEAYNAHDETDLNYFRLNISGMSHMREDMYSLGMLATEYDGHPEWPDEADFNIPEDVDLWGDEVTDPNALKYLAAGDAVRAWSPENVAGIPVHKFGSNDGWIVTPADITSALATLDAADPARVEQIRKEWIFNGATTSYFDDWIEFLKRAADGSGFRVY